MMTQYGDGDVSEHWTNSKAALVLTGSITTLTAIARSLGLSEQAVIEERHGKAMLGLWGDPLRLYQDLKRLGQIPPSLDLSR